MTWCAHALAILRATSGSTAEDLLPFLAGLALALLIGQPGRQ